MKKLVIVMIVLALIAGSAFAAKAKKAPAPTPTIVVPTPVPTPTLTTMGTIKAKIKGLFGKKAAAVPENAAPAAATAVAKEAPAK